MWMLSTKALVLDCNKSVEAVDFDDEKTGGGDGWGKWLYIRRQLKRSSL